jgi:hypothetical protein
VTQLAGLALTVWERVVELWELAVRRDRAAIVASLHPRYTGWERGSTQPHDRFAAVASVTGESPTIVSYALEPHVVEVFDDLVGVAHYGYRAQVLAAGGVSRGVKGRWTEVYLFSGGTWLLIAVHGGPDTGTESAHKDRSPGAA